MKRLLSLGAAALAAALLTQTLAAQDAPRRDGAASRPAREGPIARIAEELKLTADQTAKLKQVLETFRQANENWENENRAALKEAREKLEAARKSGKDEDLKAAREAMEKILATRKDLIENLKKQLADVPLTPEQVEKVVRIIAPGPAGPGPLGRPMMLLRELNLSEQQMELVKKILDQARADAEKADTPKAKEEILRAAFEKVRKEVLTDEQREKLAELEKNRPVPAGPGGPGELPPMLTRLKLTDEQATKAKAIWAEAQKTDGSETERRFAMRRALDKIVSDVLTAEQKEEFNKAMEAGARGEGPRPPQTGAPPK